jgi:hypothetical protein
MTHTEQCSVFSYTKVRLSSGGYSEGDPLLETLAPTWYSITQQSGNDIQLNQRTATESVFEVVTNYRPGFSWQRIMFIATRFGNLDITNIVESKRKREVTLTAVRVEGVTGGTGTGGNVGGRVLTYYANATPGSVSLEIPALADMTLLLVFRDGMNKEIVNVTPTDTKKMQWDSDNNRFLLMADDIFGDELITVLYKTSQ